MIMEKDYMINIFLDDGDYDIFFDKKDIDRCVEKIRDLDDNPTLCKKIENLIKTRYICYYISNNTFLIKSVKPNEILMNTLIALFDDEIDGIDEINIKCIDDTDTIRKIIFKKNSNIQQYHDIIKNDEHLSFFYDKIANNDSGNIIYLNGMDKIFIDCLYYKIRALIKNEDYDIE